MRNAACACFLSSRLLKKHGKLEVGRKSSRGLLSWWADLEDGKPTNVSGGRRQRQRGSPQTACFKAVWGKVGEAWPGKEIDAG